MSNKKFHFEFKRELLNFRIFFFLRDLFLFPKIKFNINKKYIFVNYNKYKLLIFILKKKISKHAQYIYIYIYIFLFQ